MGSGAWLSADQSHAGADPPAAARPRAPVSLSFGQLLRRYRGASGLTQEQLAERSGYSPDSISKLERDQRQPPQVTITRLAMVLGLDDDARGVLQAARTQFDRLDAGSAASTASAGQQPARATSGAEPVERVPARGAPPSSLPQQVTSFVGREREIAEVTALLLQDGVRMRTLSGAGGIGKTRLGLRAAEGLQARGRAERAARLGGVVVELRDRLGASMAPAEDEDRERALRLAQASLGDAAFRHAWDQGRALDLDDALAFALD